MQAFKKITEKQLDCDEDQMVRRIPGKRRRGPPNPRWKDACKRDMTKAELKEDNTSNRAAWGKKIDSHTGDPR